MELVYVIEFKEDLCKSVTVGTDFYTKTVQESISKAAYKENYLLLLILLCIFLQYHLPPLTIYTFNIYTLLALKKNCLRYNVWLKQVVTIYY